MANFSHLHMHSSYSILDAITKTSDIVKRLKEYGHTHALLTDHGTIGGVPEFFAAAKEVGIKPLAGTEIYMVPDTDEYKERGDRMAHHLILMAMNDEGWRNIKKLTTEANKNFYYYPRVGFKHLKEHNAGIIALTACLKGVVPYNISIEKYDVAAEHARTLHSIFGDRFYFEVQDGGLNIQPKINSVMRTMAKHMGIKVVGCQDAHYLDRNDVEAHEAIWALRTRDTFDKPVGYGKGKEFRPYYSTREYWLKDMCHILGEQIVTEDGERRPSDITQAELELSQEIAERCGTVNIGYQMHLPRYEFIPETAGGCATKCSDSIELHSHRPSDAELDLTSFNYLRELVYNGFELRYKTPIANATQEQKDRLDKELGDIKEARLADYFLIIWDIVSWARSKKIPIGPGRGSAAGSMVSYCLRITSIDPLQYGLIWERFFNKGRIGSLADIDLDFSMSRREEVIQYMENRFGKNRVAQMVTYNTLASKAALKDTARILGKNGISPADATLMTKFVKDKVDDIADALEKSEELRKFQEKHPRLFDIAMKIEGCPKSSGKHAAGVIISDTDFDDGEVPLRRDPKKGNMITELDGVTMDKLGYVKVDVLGLKTLDVLDGTKNDVNRRVNA